MATMVLLIFITISLLLSLLSVKSTENKVIRSKSNSFNFAPKTTHSQLSELSITKRSSGERSKSNFHPTSTLIKQNSDGLPQKLQKIASEIKYELLDCFDAIAYAESNAEVILPNYFV